MFSKGQADSRWRTDGDRVFMLLQAYALAVGGLRDALNPPPDAVWLPDPNAMKQGALDAGDEFYTALGGWVHEHAPGSGKDPSKGGFAALSMSMQDAYRAASLSLLTTLGLTLYRAPVEADRRIHEIEAADSIAIDWYNSAAAIASSLVSTGEPRGTRFMSVYKERVTKPHAAAAGAYTRLQPYIDGMPARLNAATRPDPAT